MAAGLVASGVSAQKLVWEKDWSTADKWDYYVMGYTPEVKDGALTSTNPMNEDGTAAWYQYFVAAGMSVKSGESYTVVVNCKASEETSVALQLRWAWNDDSVIDGTLKIGTEWGDSEINYKKPVNATSADLILQTTFPGTIQIKSIKLYQNPPAAQYDTEDVKTVIYADGYDCEAIDATPVVENGVLTFPADGEMFTAMEGVVYQPETLYGIKTKIKGSKSGSVQVSMGDWGSVAVEQLDVTADWQEVQLLVGEIPADGCGVDGFVNIVTKDEEEGQFYDGVLEMEYLTVATFTEIPPVVIPTEWVSVIGNGNANDGESTNLLDREPEKEDYEATICDNPDGDGKVFYCPIVNNPDPGLNPQSDEDKAAHPEWSGVYDWSSQFFIVFDEPLLEGDYVMIDFDYYCSDTRTINTQAHGKPGNYQHWQFIGDLAAKPEWQHKAWEGEISGSQAGQAGCLSMAFNLSTAEPAATFYINNVVVKVEREVSEGVAPVKAIIVPAQGVYNMQGIKVANNLDEVKTNGIFIANGKKVVVRK